MKRAVCCSALLAATTALAQDRTMPPESERQLARAIYKEMVETKSGYTTGATTPVVEAVAKRLKAAGFPAADIFVGGPTPKKANLVVRYRGTGRRKPILLLAHTDVVEAKREDWSMDPFTFAEKDGYFYGRGTGDDKAQAAIWIANLIRYKREGFKPDRDIIVALTADEEGGGPYNGVQWLLANKRPLTFSSARSTSSITASRYATRAVTAPCPLPTTRSIISPVRSTGSPSLHSRSRPTTSRARTSERWPESRRGQ